LNEAIDGGRYDPPWPLAAAAAAVAIDQDEAWRGFTDEDNSVAYEADKFEGRRYDEVDMGSVDVDASRVVLGD
jgi:hypothetical protein